MKKTLVAAFSALAFSAMTPAAMAAPGDHKGLANAVDPRDTNLALPTLQFFSVTKAELDAVGAKLALSMFNAKGEPVIFYDEETLAQYPKEFQMFIYRHEQNHFTGGDFAAQESVMQKSMGYRSEENSQEEVADCQAVKDLRQAFRFTPAQIEIVANTAEQVFANGQGTRVAQGGGFGYAHRFAYPSSRDRAKNILACY